MDLKNYSTGVQHIGIPTNDIDKTVEFYHKLGFETAFETVNEEANEKVVFLKLGTLVVETYENHAAKMEHGAIDHVALDVKDIEEIFQYIKAHAKGQKSAPRSPFPGARRAGPAIFFCACGSPQSAFSARYSLPPHPGQNMACGSTSAPHWGQ